MIVVVDRIFPIENIVYVNVFKVNSCSWLELNSTLGGFCQRRICLE